jgi:hypothetical protein
VPNFIPHFSPLIIDKPIKITILGVDGDCGGNKKMLFRIPSGDNETMNKMKNDGHAAQHAIDKAEVEGIHT